MVNKTLIPRILKPANVSFFLFGARGTGKSTWLRVTYPDAVTINLLDEALYQSYLYDIRLFSNRLNTLPEGSLVIIDEVQRLPSLLNEVHRFMEERSLRFILCGSSARKLKTTQTNLLAGRASWRQMYPFVPAELREAFDVDDTLRHGSLPIVWASQDREEVLRAYTEMYLKEEIQAEALVRNLPGFSRFLPVAALFHGQVMNIASLARDAGVARSTVVGYLEILEKTLLTFFLPAYEGRLRVRERKHPKLYWVDPGLVRAVRRRYQAPTPEEKGALLEGWIATLLRVYTEYSNICDAMYYWTPLDAHQVEVDFLLEKNERFVAIEVKSSHRIDNSMLKGLRAVRSLAGLVRRIAVYMGDEPLRTDDGIDILPLHRFIEALPEGIWG